MKAGQLVKWSCSWLAGFTKQQMAKGKIEHYRNQIGVLIERVDNPANCWAVAWSDGEISTVHKEFLEDA